MANNNKCEVYGCGKYAPKLCVNQLEGDLDLVNADQSRSDSKNWDAVNKAYARQALEQYRQKGCKLPADEAQNIIARFPD